MGLISNIKEAKSNEKIDEALEEAYSTLNFVLLGDMNKELNKINNRLKDSMKIET